MAQLSTNTIFYDQLIKAVQEFLRKYSNNQISSHDEMAHDMQELITFVNRYSGSPTTQYEQVIKGEPPSSAKFNRFVSGIADDLNIAAKQLDYQSAQIVSLYNMFNAEIEKENQFTNRIKSKVKVLQAYSESPSNDLYYLGDSFENMDFVDVSKIPKNYSMMIKDGSARLPISSSTAWTPKSVSVIDGESNGFIGNNHAVNASNGVDSNYRYSFQDNPSVGLIGNSIDNNPLTYFEYEGINIDNSLKKKNNAKDFEFTYSFQEEIDGKKVNNFKGWSDKNLTEPLRLSLKLTSVSAQRANAIDIIPYFGTVENVYSELKVVAVTAISASTRQLVQLIDRPIYIGSSFLPQSIESSKNYFYNKASVTFPEIVTNEINVYFEQPNYNDINVQHLYWQPLPSSGRLAALDAQTRFDPSSLSSLGFQDVQYDMKELVPTIVQPNQYKDLSSLSTRRIDITFKDQNFGSKYIVTFKRMKNSSIVKMYYTNSFTGLETPLVQQQKSATEDSKLAWQHESIESANAAIVFMQSKIASSEWSADNYQELKTEKIQTSFEPKTRAIPIPLKRKFEIYPAKRAAIGIRSIDVYNNMYQSNGEIVSKPFVFPYDVKNLTMSADVKLDSRSLNNTSQYVKYSVSLDDGKTWILISPIENPFSGVPEILSFNENISSLGQVKGVSYFNYPDIPKETKNIRVKIELTKPRNYNISPIVYSYQIAGRVEQV